MGFRRYVCPLFAFCLVHMKVVKCLLQIRNDCVMGSRQARTFCDEHIIILRFAKVRNNLSDSRSKSSLYAVSLYRIADLRCNRQSHTATIGTILDLGAFVLQGKVSGGVPLTRTQPNKITTLSERD